MEEEQTCGKGLAEHSVLPASLGELMAATARVLEVHMKALDVSDANAKRESDAYRELAATHRRIAGELSTLAQRMAGYRTLPAAPHDMAAMMSAAPLHAFKSFVAHEESLMNLLQTRLAEDRAMIAAMQSGPET